jgi:hypothetical protein
VVKYIFVGIWVCAVTLGAAYGVMYWRAQQQQAAAHPIAPKIEIEQIKTKMISVPLVLNGTVHGYVLAQFTFTVEAKAANALPVKPDIYLVDEAFRLIYAGEAIDFRTLRKPDVAALGRLIKESVNKRFGTELVKEVFVQELNYVPKEQFRGGASPKM